MSERYRIHSIASFSCNLSGIVPNPPPEYNPAAADKRLIPSHSLKNFLFKKSHISFMLL